MKKLKLLLVLTLSIGMLACDKDDPKPAPTTQELLVGKWMLTSLVSSGTEVVLDDCFKKTYFQFEKDGSFLLMDYTVVETGSPCTPRATVANFSLSADNSKIILVSDEGESAVIEILSFTAQTMVANFYESEMTLTKI